MNILLLGLVLYSYFVSSAPKVFKENKQLVLGIFIGVTIYQMNLVEGFPSKKYDIKDPFSGEWVADNYYVQGNNIDGINPPCEECICREDDSKSNLDGSGGQTNKFWCCSSDCDDIGEPVGTIYIKLSIKKVKPSKINSIEWWKSIVEGYPDKNVNITPFNTNNPSNDCIKKAGMGILSECSWTSEDPDIEGDVLSLMVFPIHISKINDRGEFENLVKKMIKDKLPNSTIDILDIINGQTYQCSNTPVHGGYPFLKGKADKCSDEDKLIGITNHYHSCNNYDDINEKCYLWGKTNALYAYRNLIRDGNDIQTGYNNIQTEYNNIQAELSNNISDLSECRRELSSLTPSNDQPPI